ncbi:unnamed protein product [Penicillium glandicola]
MSQSPDVNLDDLSLYFLLQQGLIIPGVNYSESLLARRPPTEISPGTTIQPGYNTYGESLASFGEHVTTASPITSPSVHRSTAHYFAANNIDPRALAMGFPRPTDYIARASPPLGSPSMQYQPNQNALQYDAVNDMVPRVDATAFGYPVNHITGAAPPMPSPPMHHQPSQNAAQYYAVDNNDSQAVPIAFGCPAHHTTAATSLVSPSVGQELPLQQRSRPGVSTLEALRDGSTNGETLDGHDHGLEQDNPGTIFRCDWKGCKYDGTFSAKGSLTRHRIEQHTIQVFPCPKCGKSYSRSSRTTEHQQKVHGMQARGK